MTSGQVTRKQGNAIDAVVKAGTIVQIAGVKVELVADSEVIVDKRDYRASSTARMVLVVPCAAKSAPTSIT